MPLASFYNTTDENALPLKIHNTLDSNKLFHMMYNNAEKALRTQENNLIGSLNVDNEQTVVSDVLTFDQIVEIMAKDNNISIMEAANQIIEKSSNNRIRNNALSRYDLKILATAATYRVASSRFTVTSTYRPTLRFHLQTSEGGGFWGIRKVLNVGMNRLYMGKTKQFGGTVYAKLENPGKIFWIVNGDFFLNGTTTVGAGIDLGLGEGASLNFHISHSSDHYAYTYVEGNFNIH
ncbi:MAG: hypothetical protein COA82_09895 [Alkaliphilus sp.]|nr:hypothetical protein [bacterium AH-315-L21]MBN4056553.1 hypothetical protein [bacterium AH-315-K05]MBN4074312.1 hypothetical protein [bacterium AH-315-E09]PHS31779.1 MAG: hypothetical protein COA82_09895 [Alkaliphilus sp.]